MRDPGNLLGGWKYPRRLCVRADVELKFVCGGESAGTGILAEGARQQAADVGQGGTGSCP